MKNNKKPLPNSSLFIEQEPATLLSRLLDESDTLFVKKLSLNDRDWARLPNKHQAGVYVPPAERDGGFFPALATKVRDQADADEIREAFFDLDWMALGETRQARLVHYTSKGTETHLTRLPKPAFQDLAPASLLVIGKTGSRYRVLTLDSGSEDCDLLVDTLSLPPDFRSGLFDLAEVRRTQKDKAADFIEEVVRACLDGSIAALARRHANIPKTEELASLARAQFLAESGLASLDPFAMAKPGDAIRTISRGLEYSIFKDLQMKARSLELVRMIFGDDPKAMTVEKVLRAVVGQYQQIDDLLLSAAQQRKSRAGYSFEHHIEAMLIGGRIPFQKQVLIQAKKRPDFILPSFSLYDELGRTPREALVLSAKTTLRERWKQVNQEIKECDLYLATVDENIATNAIEDMASQGIMLIVPESLKNSDTTEYRKQSSVLSFRTFFDEEIVKARWPLWVARGLVVPRK